MIRVLLADDHTILRQGLRTLMESEEEISVVGEASNGQEAVNLALELEPDVVLMDISMPVMNGFEATLAIRSKIPQTKILALTQHDSEEYLFKLLSSGASGYVLKKTAAGELIVAIKAAHEGLVYLSPVMTQKLVSEHLRLLKEPKGRNDLLTPREMEVLKLVAEGLTNQEIADKLVLSLKTVQTHRAHLMEKLNLHDRTELVKYALKKGILKLEEETA